MATPKLLKKEIRKYKGESFLFGIRLVDEFGNPLDLTGFSAKCQVRESSGDGDPGTPNANLAPLLEFTVEEGSVVIVPKEGRIVLFKPVLDKVMDAVYDIFLIGPNDTKILLVDPKSKFKVLETVTNV